MAGQQPLNFFEHLDEINDLVSDKDIFLFLDYDGTLTPIVATPDLAVISDEMRDVVARAAASMITSVVSGRATDDVRSKMRLEGIFYAGSHGFEIVDPQGRVTVNEEAESVQATINEVHQKLSERLKHVEGALVENVKYTISSHYRLVADKDFPQVQKAVKDILKEYPILRMTEGKKVFEIRPKIDWDKGRAVQWILQFLKYNDKKHIPVYIGDDTTDEDGFRFLKNKGLGILVADPPRASEAHYVIPNTQEVKKVLEFYVKIKKGKIH